MIFEERKKAFLELGYSINLALEEINQGNNPSNDELVRAVYDEQNNNPWFIPRFVISSLEGIRFMLKKENLEKWLSPYEDALKKNRNPSRVGVIMAGNIPLVGFHDFMTVLLAGNKFVGKTSSKDNRLFKILADKLVGIHKGFEERVVLKEQTIGAVDAIIATGSNNSARYFEYYFGKYPHVIRKSRTSAAILSGNEAKAAKEALADDIYMYFGLGCRNVSKLFIPANYKIEDLIDSFDKYSFFRDHHKYMNNYEYNKAIYLINQDPHLDNGFMLFKEDTALYSPLSVIHYQRYNNKEALIQHLESEKENLQCVVGKIDEAHNAVNFGEAQSPPPWEYADNIDTMAFLISLNPE